MKMKTLKKTTINKIKKPLKMRDFLRADGGTRTHDLLIKNQLLEPAELHRLLKTANIIVKIIFANLLKKNY